MIPEGWRISAGRRCFGIGSNWNQILDLSWLSLFVILDWMMVIIMLSVPHLLVRDFITPFALAFYQEQAEVASSAHVRILKDADACDDDDHVLAFEDISLAPFELAKLRVLACAGVLDEVHVFAHHGVCPVAHCSQASLHCRVDQCRCPFRFGTLACTFLVFSTSSLFASPHGPSS